jgi:hypothetical protein
MKRLFIVVSLLLTFIIGGCATIKPAYHSQMKEGVYIDYTYSWVNSPAKRSSPIGSVTLRLINKKYVDAFVTVICAYSDATIFGKRSVVVKERNDNIFVIYGFVRMEDESVGCKITSVK